MSTSLETSADQRTYHYFLSFTTVLVDGGVCVGNAPYAGPAPLNDFEQIQGIQKLLEAKLPRARSVCIQNWILLRVEDTPYVGS